MIDFHLLLLLSYLLFVFCIKNYGRKSFLTYGLCGELPAGDFVLCGQTFFQVALVFVWVGVAEQLFVLKAEAHIF